MSAVLWVLAVLDLIGGFIIGNEINNPIVGITIGVVGFAILGGFAAVINLLKEISLSTSNLNDSIAHLSEIEKLLKAKNDSPSSDPVRNYVNQIGTTITSKAVQENKDTVISKEPWVNPNVEKAEYPIPTDIPDTVCCPKCGEKQRAGRYKCWKCGIPFMYDE